MTQPAYCTILARNYLPAALTLSESLREHGDGTALTVFLIDADENTELPEVPGVRWMHPGMLDLSERAVLNLAMYYDLVEFATAVKPLVLGALLREHEHVAYLDPDTYVVSPMAELGPSLEAGSGILLTPHFLQPPPAESQFSEGHLLYVGFYNLGFCAVDRRAADFLEWWWGHLSTECLHEPLDGLFVDQRWVDLGAGFFGAGSLRHHGYNVGVANLHERPIAEDEDGYYVDGTEGRLRLFHFHAFDPRRPEILTTRFALSDGRTDREALQALARDYADRVLANEQQIGPQPAYRYASDSAGRPISRRLRRAYRMASLADSETLPSPFRASEGEEFEQWRAGARRMVGRLMLSDLAKATRMSLPEEYERVKRRLPGATTRLRGRIIEKTGWMN